MAKKIDSPQLQCKVSPKFLQTQFYYNLKSTELFKIKERYGRSEINTFTSNQGLVSRERISYDRPVQLNVANRS